ncbi:MAG: thermonuclease family protein [Thermoanaerobaculia bacterium]
MTSHVRVVVAVLSLTGVLPLYAAGSSMAHVKSIVTGNTLVVEMRGVQSTIHLYGIAAADPQDDRPKIQRLASEAQDFMREYLKSGWVYLEFPSGEPKPNKDGTVSALVYRDRDAGFVNEQLVAAGLGVVDDDAEGELREKLLVKQEGAREAMLGLWGEFMSANGTRVANGSAHAGTFIGHPGDNQKDYWVKEMLHWLTRAKAPRYPYGR